MRPKPCSPRRPYPGAEVARLTRELNEALEQQAATSEVLGIISASPGKLERVFQSILENATRICEAKFGTLFRFDGSCPPAGSASRHAVGFDRGSETARTAGRPGGRA